ncbi:hypothetical protein ES707_16717 [subsurface metagenome]
MLQIELVPDIDHCIETVARREHEAVLKQLLTPGKGNKELEEKLEILRLFLERADFRQLRSKSERQLTEGKRVRFLAYLEEGMPKYEMHVM